MKRLYNFLKTTAALMLMLTAFGSATQAQTDMFVVSPYVDSVWTVDTATMVTQLPGRALTLPGSTVTGMNGLSVNPFTNEVWGMFKVSGVTGRLLGTLDVMTGAVTIVGNTGDNIASFDWYDATTMIAVTGDGGNTSEGVFFMDAATAALTLIGSSPAGSDGESGAYCDDNGKFYRWSGRDTNPAMEAWDPGSGTFTTVARTGFNYDEVMGSTYIGGGQFLLANLDQEYIVVDTSGFAVNTNLTTHNYYKGMVLWTAGISIANQGPDIICAGDTAWLDANITDTLQWYMDGNVIAGANSQTYGATMSGDYSVIGVMDGVLDTSNVITITVAPLPVLTINNSNPDYICTGDSLLLTGTFSGADTLRWMLNDTTEFNPYVNNDSAWVSVPGSYTFEGMDMASGCGAASAPIIVMDQPTLTSGPGGTVDLCGTDTAILTASPAGATSYQWYMDGVMIGGANADTYDAMMAGDYSVSAMWGGCTDSVGSTMVNVFPTATLTPQGSNAICITDTMLLMTDTGATSYQWYHDGNAIGANVASFNATMAGDYSVVVTWGGGTCVDSISGSTVTVDPLNTASFTQSATNVDVAIDGDVTFTGTATGGTISWDFGDGGSDTGPNPTHTYTVAGTYTVTMTVSGGACPDATATSTVVVINTTGIDQVLAGGVTLLQNRPNPITNTTTFEFSLAKDAKVSLSVYNILGDEVARVYEGQAQAGVNTYNWNATDNDGGQLPSGTYVYTLRVDGTPISNSLVILK